MKKVIKLLLLLGSLFFYSCGDERVIPERKRTSMVLWKADK